MTSEYSKGKIWNGKVSNATSHGASPTAAEWDQLLEELTDCFPSTFSHTALLNTIQTLTNPGMLGTLGDATQKLAQWVKTTVVLDDTVINMTDADAAGSHGTGELFSFPVGEIVVATLLGNLTLIAGIGGIDDDAIIRAGIGTGLIQTNNSTLTGTEDDILNSGGDTNLSGGVGLWQEVASLITFDNVAGGLKANLNLAVRGQDSSADDTLTATGAITLIWTGLTF